MNISTAQAQQKQLKQYVRHFQANYSRYHEKLMYSYTDI